MRPIMDFLYAVPLRELSTPFPKALVKQGHKIALSSPEGGIGQINEWFLDNVASEKIHVSTPVEGLTRESQMWRVSYAGGSILVDSVIMIARARHMSTHYTELATRGPIIIGRRSPQPGTGRKWLGFNTPIKDMSDIGFVPLRKTGQMRIAGRHKTGGRLFLPSRVECCS